MLTLPFKLLAFIGGAGAVGAVAAIAVMGTPPKSPPAARPPVADAAVTATPPPAAPVVAVPEAPQKPQADQGPDPETLRPRFDVVRVEAGGDVVVAGRAGPGATVDLLVAGKKYDRAIADLGGQFAIVPRPLPPGEHQLSLRARMPEGTSLDSRQSVTVIVPDSKAKSALVAVAEPDRPTQLLQLPVAPPASPQPPAVPAPASPALDAPRPAAAPAATAQVEAVRRPVSVTLVEADDAGRLFASGKAAAGASVRLYLNNAFLAVAEAAGSGDWSFTILRGLAPGRYDVRLDDVEAGTGKVLSRAEVSFLMAARQEPARPAAVAAAPPPAVSPTPPPGAQAVPPPVAPAASAPAAAAPVAVAAAPAAPPNVSVPLPPSPSAVIIGDVRSETVRRGDSLWRISRRIYGQGVRYTTIFAANTDQIRDPARIYPGQIFVMPRELPPETTARQTPG